MLAAVEAMLLYTTESSEVECRVAPVVLTKDNIGEFQVTDLVLPLPGYDVQYPDNDTASWYRELLAADGFEDFSFRNRVKLARRFVLHQLIVPPVKLST